MGCVVCEDRKTRLAKKKNELIIVNSSVIVSKVHLYLLTMALVVKPRTSLHTYI